MEQYAKNFLPILFSIYINGVEDWAADGKTMTKVDPNAIHQSTLATIRLYMHSIPKSLLKKYIAIATSKLLVNMDAPSGEEIISEQKVCIINLLCLLFLSTTAKG